jgi:hypothetical protein
MGNNFEIAKTIDFVETFFGFTLSDKSRKRPVVEARMMYAKLMKRHSNCSLSEIGKAISKDHATIIHYLNNFQWFKKGDVKFSDTFDLLSDMYEEYRKVWFDDSKYDDSRKIQFLENALKETKLEKEKYEKYIKKIKRIESIVQMIEERTPRGEEEYVESKINRMFNSIIFNP